MRSWQPHYIQWCHLCHIHGVWQLLSKTIYIQRNLWYSHVLQTAHYILVDQMRHVSGNFPSLISMSLIKQGINIQKRLGKCVEILLRGVEFRLESVKSLCHTQSWNSNLCPTQVHRSPKILIVITYKYWINLIYRGYNTLKSIKPTIKNKT